MEKITKFKYLGKLRTSKTLQKKKSMSEVQQHGAVLENKQRYTSR